MKHIKQDGTKGILNKINERYGCNQKRRTIPIQDLIKYHAPKQQAELVALIESHQDTGVHSNCACGCKSAGTLETFADRLYTSYVKYVAEVDNGAEYKDWEDCYTFMKHLFVVNSLKGNMMENEVLKYINQNIDKRYKAELASTIYDFQFAVDIVIKTLDDVEVFGVQVKPNSYKNFPKTHDVVKQNITKNIKYGKEVVYVYYDINNVIVDQELINKELLMNVNKHLSSSIPKLNY